MNAMMLTARLLPGPCIGLCLMLAIPAFGAPQTTEVEGKPLLTEGTWKGFYKPELSDRNDAVFTVKQVANGTFQIEMRLKDLEPRDKFIYTLHEIKLDGDILTFTFGEGNDTRECQLERKSDAILEGTCSYRNDPEQAVRASIEMRPPSDEEEEECQRCD